MEDGDRARWCLEIRTPGKASRIPAVRSGGGRGREQGQGHRCKWLLLLMDSERLPHGLDSFIELVTVPGGPALCWALGTQPGEGHSPVHREASQTLRSERRQDPTAAPPLEVSRGPGERQLPAGGDV